jgi:hypothetical protein
MKVTLGEIGIQDVLDTKARILANLEIFVRRMVLLIYRQEISFLDWKEICDPQLPDPVR